MDLNKLVSEIKEKNKISLMKEIKEITSLTNDIEEIKGLFSINIIIKVMNEKLVGFKERSFGEENSHFNKHFRRAIVNFISSHVIMNHIFKKDDFLNDYIDEKMLKELMSKISDQEHLLMSLNTAEVQIFKKHLLSEYTKDQLSTSAIMEEYDIHFGFMDKSMSKENFFLNKLEKELQKINENIIRQKSNNNKYYYSPHALTGAINPLASDYFVEILKEMNECNVKDRAEMKIIFLTKKLLEWKNEKRKEELYITISDSDISKDHIERKRNKI